MKTTICCVAAVLVAGVSYAVEIPPADLPVIKKIYDYQTTQALALKAQADDLTKNLRQFDPSSTGLERQRLVKERQAKIAELKAKAKKLEAHEDVVLPFAADMSEKGSIGGIDTIRFIVVSNDGNELLIEYNPLLWDPTKGRDPRDTRSSRLRLVPLKPSDAREGEKFERPELVEVMRTGDVPTVREIDWAKLQPAYQEYVKSMKK